MATRFCFIVGLRRPYCGYGHAAKNASYRNEKIEHVLHPSCGHRLRDALPAKGLVDSAGKLRAGQCGRRADRVRFWSTDLPCARSHLTMTMCSAIAAPLASVTFHMHGPAHHSRRRRPVFPSNCGKNLAAEGRTPRMFGLLHV